MPALRVPAILLLAILLAALSQAGSVQSSLDKLGLSPLSAVALFALILFGRKFNLPIFAWRSDPFSREAIIHPLPGHALRFLHVAPEKTFVAVNLGGAVIPLAFSLYLLMHAALPVESLALAVPLLTGIAYYGGTLLPAAKGGIPTLVTPLAAALAAIWLDPAHAPALAFIGGTLGILLGADILRQREASRASSSHVMIGGPGTFNGILFSGILAALLA